MLQNAGNRAFSIGITEVLNTNLLIELSADDIEYVYQRLVACKEEYCHKLQFTLNHIRASLLYVLSSGAPEKLWTLLLRLLKHLLN